MIKFLKRLLRWFLPECSRCGGTMLYDNTHSWHDEWHFVCDTCGREKWVHYEKNYRNSKNKRI